MTNAVKVDHLVKTFKLGEHEVTAIQDISFEIKQGEFVAITGASGSGKSTLLHIMGTLDCPTKGSVARSGASHRPHQVQGSWEHTGGSEGHYESYSGGPGGQRRSWGT